MPKILVIDDEPNIRDLVSVYLSAAGFEVDTAENGAEGLAQFRSGLPELVVLDLMLPGMDGKEVCRAIRAEASTPIIMLTARGSDFEKVALLEAGADDYVVKPFSPPEFVARVRAVLRRYESGGATGAAASGQTEIGLGALEIRPAERFVSVDGVEVALTAREFDLLLAMAEQPGVVLSREQLLERVTGESEYADARGVDVHVRHLREKLGDDAAAPRFVETVRGVGYRMRKDAG